MSFLDSHKVPQRTNNLGFIKISKTVLNPDEKNSPYKTLFPEYDFISNLVAPSWLTLIISSPLILSDV